MESFFKRYQNQSVLNTDSFDRRRFQKIYNMSGKLQELSEIERPFPTFQALLSDIWGAFYKMSPELKDDEEIDDPIKTNYSLMNQILNDGEFRKHREVTKLDELTSAIGTIKFGEKTKEWLEKQRQKNKELDQQLQLIQSMQRQLEKQEKENGAGQGNPQLENDLENAVKNVHETVAQALQKNRNSFSKKLAEAITDTKNVKNEVKTLLGGMEQGSGEASLQKTPLRDQLKLAEKIAENKHLKSIAAWAGRFKAIARQKQKSLYSDSVERSGVALGNRIEQLLPSELALYGHETTKPDFLRRFAEGHTMQYDTKAKEALGKGPIILCLDQSGSMRTRDAQSKGFALALISMAKRQKRDFCYIPFSTKVETYRYPKGKISTPEMIGLSESFLDGGTDFQMPLTQALKVINETRFKQSDIIFVTDGEANIKRDFLEKFNKVKKDKKFSVLSLVIGDGGLKQTPKQFSDRVVTITNFNDKGSYTAFEL